MSKKILILGASGRYGRTCAEAFELSGWEVHRFNRKTDDLAVAAKGMDVILNGWNPAYTDWPKLLPILTGQIITAAKSADATVILPANVYVFGKDAAQNFNETTPHNAQNELGQIRINMEAAYRESGLRTILLRAGDFLDTRASGNWFDMIMAKRLPKGVFTYPGPTDIPHAWAYLPDLARATVALAENRDSLAVFEDIPYPGYTLSGADLHTAVQKAVGQNITLKRMSWLPIRAMSPFWAMGRRLAEMRYLWAKPHHLDGTKFNRLLPKFTPTPVDVAVARALSFHVNPDKAVARSPVTT